MKVTVTAEHIAAGLRGEISLCPVALAIRDAGAPGATVTSSYARIPHESGAPGKAVVVYFPEAVDDRILSFDSGKGMEPFSFDLDTDNPRESL